MRHNTYLKEFSNRQLCQRSSAQDAKMNSTVRNFGGGLDLGVTWVCIHDLTWHQNDLKVD